MRGFLTTKTVLCLAAALTLCVLSDGGAYAADQPTLLEVARSPYQWTGVAVTADGRVFANFPRWSDKVPVSVVEITASGDLKPYPNMEWNRWSRADSPLHKFICVQSVVVGPAGYLWVLDTGNPEFAGVIPNGAKLAKIDLDKDEVVEVIYFDENVVFSDSYLNDVRIDPERFHAYITDSRRGGLLVTYLTTQVTRRVLTEHPSTQSAGVDVAINGKPWKRADGSKPEVASDGIALDRENDYVYYQALTSNTLYRIPGAALRNPFLGKEDRNAKVEKVADSGVADGILFHQGYVYLTSLTENAVKRVRPGEPAEMVVQSDKLRWPDSLSLGPKGYMFVSTSQIHLAPKVPGPYMIYKFQPPEPKPMPEKPAPKPEEPEQQQAEEPAEQKPAEEAETQSDEPPAE